MNNQTRCICAFAQNLDQQSIIGKNIIKKQKRNKKIGLIFDLLKAICADGTYYKYSIESANNSKMCQLESCTKFLELTSR